MWRDSPPRISQREFSDCAGHPVNTHRSTLARKKECSRISPCDENGTMVLHPVFQQRDEISGQYELDFDMRLSVLLFKVRLPELLARILIERFDYPLGF